MKNVILFLGMFLIILVSFCAVKKDDIAYRFMANSIEKKYGTTVENEYFVEDSFEFIDNYSDSRLTSYNDLMGSIYYTINSGATYTEKYCDVNYTSCISDLENIANNIDLLSSFNNFVHPYNSFSTMEFNHDDKAISIKIEHIYSDDYMKQLNQIVNKVIDEKLDNSMTTIDKIKAIHDYIIDITDYDTLKSDNIEDTTYSSNTAYGVLVEKKGICSGYSDAMAIFLNKLNIINYKISNEEHIWNYVYVDGKWYHLDLTWDDPVSDKNITRDNYFMITTANLEYLNDDTHGFNKDIYVEAK